MSATLFVQKLQERLFGPRARVRLDLTTFTRRLNKLDSREPADAILARERAGGGVVRVEVGDFAAVVAVKGRGDLGPDGFERLAVAAPRCEKGNEGAFGLGRDYASGNVEGQHFRLLTGTGGKREADPSKFLAERTVCV